jgi:hypothetical protein
MRDKMRVFSTAAAVLVLALAQPAFAQQPRLPAYGETEKDKSTQERQDERDRQKAYDRSLKNIPDKGPSDPWGSVRSNDAPKTPASKPKKTATPQ